MAFKRSGVRSPPPPLDDCNEPHGEATPASPFAFSGHDCESVRLSAEPAAPENALRCTAFRAAFVRPSTVALRPPPVLIGKDVDRSSLGLVPRGFQMSERSRPGFLDQPVRATGSGTSSKAPAFSKDPSEKLATARFRTELIDELFRLFPSQVAGSPLERSASTLRHIMLCTAEVQKCSTKFPTK